jgi:VWFA-related protein
MLLPSHAQQQSVSGESNPVSIFFTVLDKDKHFVTTLRREDIRVVEDGVPQEIVAFQQQTDQPLSIMIMLDTSVSQERVIPAAKQVASGFIDSIIRSGKDRIGIITFTGTAELEQELTSDLNQVRQALERVEFKPPPGYAGGGLVFSKPPKSSTNQAVPGSTAIWDAVWFASEKFFDQTSGKTRQAIILLTDGQDTGSKHKLNEAIERAIQANVPVYSIGIGDEYFGGTDESSLRKVSERTGGRSFFPKKVKDLQAVFAEIEQELRSQYLITYSPTINKGDGKLHKVKIEIVNPELRKQGLQLSHQQGYYAKKG